MRQRHHKRIASWLIVLLVSASVDTVCGVKALSVEAATVAAPATPLPQATGTHLGPRVDGSVKHGAYNGVTPIVYPANLSAATRGKLLSTRDVLTRVRLDAGGAQKQGLIVQGINLVRWGAIEKRNYMHGTTLLFVSANRLVYEVVTKFSRPLSYKGNTWSSGTRIVIIDAETGEAIFGGFQGHATYSSHLQMMHPRTTDFHSKPY